MPPIDQPIIKKVKKVAGHGHHGGAWKIAYADFVTAMMAFFLLMWLLGSTDDTTKRGISEYFQNPDVVTIHAGEGGTDNGDRQHIIQGGGDDLTNQNKGQTLNGSTENPFPDDIEKLFEEQEQKKLEELRESIEKILEEKLILYKDQIKLEATPEGLKIQIVDTQNRPMFKLASSNVEEHVKVILKELTPVINDLPNRISINGHTDALPFPDNKRGYSNWELSTDRANMVRAELLINGMAKDKVLRVVGLASEIPLIVQNPEDPMNRRISIIVMNKKTEEQILKQND